jgi:hypothetical protein
VLSGAEQPYFSTEIKQQISYKIRYFYVDSSILKTSPKNEFSCSVGGITVKNEYYQRKISRQKVAQILLLIRISIGDFFSAFNIQLFFQEMHCFQSNTE